MVHRFILTCHLQDIYPPSHHNYWIPFGGSSSATSCNGVIIYVDSLKHHSTRRPPGIHHICTCMLLSFKALIDVYLTCIYLMCVSLFL